MKQKSTERFTVSWTPREIELFNYAQQKYEELRGVVLSRNQFIKEALFAKWNELGLLSD